MNCSRFDINFFVGLFFINYSYNVFCEYFCMLYGGFSCFVCFWVGDIIYSKDVGVFCILELESRMDVNEVVGRVNERVGRERG